MKRFAVLEAKKRSFTLAALLLFVLTAGGAHAADLSVELPEVIEARHGTFYLGEYAVITGDEVLGDSASMAVINPAGGEFSCGDVIEALGATAAAGMSVSLKMPDVVKVLPESSVASELRAMTSWKWRIDVEGDIASGGFSLPPKVVPGARSLSLKLMTPDGDKANKQVKLRWYQPVVYSESSLQKDSRLDSSSLKRRIGTAGMTRPLVWDPSQLDDSALRRGIRAKDPIAHSDVEDALIVRSGASIKLVASVGGLGVEMKGIALERGAKGDVIKVRNLSTRKILSGTIIDAGRVSIIN